MVTSPFRYLVIAGLAIAAMFTVIYHFGDRSSAKAAGYGSARTESQQLTAALNGTRYSSFPECEAMHKEAKSSREKAPRLAAYDCMQRTASTFEERLVFAQKLHGGIGVRFTVDELKHYMDSNYAMLAAMSGSLNGQQLSALCGYYRSHSKFFPSPVAGCQ